MLYRQQGSTDGPFIETDLFGYELLNDPSLNRGTAFTHEERDFFELHGRLPPHVATLDEQVSRRTQAFQQSPSNLERYVFLRGLQDSVEVLFYALLVHDLAGMLPEDSAARNSATPSAVARTLPQLSPYGVHQAHSGQSAF
jgi:malate dehydrogenase (oxaloacetate-decarboxylating)